MDTLFYAALIILYALSIIAMKYFHDTAYSKGGIWEFQKAESLDNFVIWFPLVNTIATLLFYGVGGPMRGGFSYRKVNKRKNQRK